MKRLLTILIISLLIVSCKEETRTDYVINGKAEGVYNGIRVYLKTQGKKGREITIDTAIVFDEKFKMTGSISEPAIRILTINNVKGKSTFMLENSIIDVVVDKENMGNSLITGSKTNKTLMEYQKGWRQFQSESKSNLIAFRKLKLPEDKSKGDSLQIEMQDIELRKKKYPLNFLKEYDDDAFSLNLIQSEIENPNVDIEIYKDAFENLSPKLKTTQNGQRIAKDIDALYKQYIRNEQLNIGKVPPNFEAPNPEGTMVSLEESKGKVTIIDFWAAWCGPCRRENPNVVKIYEQYHDQGLEIIGVSLDGQSRQQNAKQAWLDAIEKDNLTWTQVSNLKYFSDPIARLYNISSIPATFILDKDGKIAAKNLRGQALELKVKELLEQ